MSGRPDRARPEIPAASADTSSQPGHIAAPGGSPEPPLFPWGDPKDETPVRYQFRDADGRLRHVALLLALELVPPGTDPASLRAPAEHGPGQEVPT